MYNDLRTIARAVVVELRLKGIDGVYLEGSDEVMGILKLICIEAGINLHSSPQRWATRREGETYRLLEQ